MAGGARGSESGKCAALAPSGTQGAGSGEGGVLPSKRGGPTVGKAGTKKEKGAAKRESALEDASDLAVQVRFS